MGHVVIVGTGSIEQLDQRLVRGASGDVEGREAVGVAYTRAWHQGGIAVGVDAIDRSAPLRAIHRPCVRALVAVMTILARSGPQVPIELEFGAR